MMKSACGPRFMRGSFCRARSYPTTGLRFSGSCALRLQDLHGARASSQDLIAHGGKMQREEQKRESERHDGERPQYRWIDGRAAGAEDRLALMQRVPPVHGEFDDRQ